MLDDDDFDDLLEGVDLLEGSSQESLTQAAANLSFDPRYLGVNTVPGSVEAVHYDVDVKEPLKPGYLECMENPGDFEKVSALPKPPSPSSTQASKSTVIEAIEGVFERMTEVLLNDKLEMAIELKRRSRPVRPASVETGHHRSGELAVKTSRVCFPGKSAEEAWRFTVAIRILEIIHEALQSEDVVSKREIYYRDPALFGSQRHVDRYVDDLALTFGVSRSALNVAAVTKGLVAGAVTFCHRDGSTINASAERGGMLIPNLKDVLSVDLGCVSWILVIEKEATFRSIATSHFWDTMASEGVLITGKGYPDIATRALLRYLSTPSPQNGFASPSVFALVDFDPDGLAITRTYKYGSAALAHESADLRVPQLRWLGLTSEHILLVAGGDAHASQGLLTLTSRDRQKASKMLERSVTLQHHREREQGTLGCDDSMLKQSKHIEKDGSNDQAGEEAQMRRELQVMLMLNVKAELQLLNAVPNGMTDLLASEFGKL